MRDIDDHGAMRESRDEIGSIGSSSSDLSVATQVVV